MSFQYNAFEEHNIIYTTISSYFGKDTILTKLRHINPEESNPTHYGLYYARIGCLLCVEDRYIVAIVPNDFNSIGTRIRLEDLNWISFQTRTIEEPPAKISTQEVKQSRNNNILSKITKVSTTSNKDIYLCDNFPIKVELLHTEENQSYAETGTIQSALDTYNCVISFTL